MTRTVQIVLVVLGLSCFAGAGVLAIVGALELAKFNRSVEDRALPPRPVGTVEKSLAPAPERYTRALPERAQPLIDSPDSFPPAEHLAGAICRGEVDVASAVLARADAAVKAGASAELMTEAYGPYLGECVRPALCDRLRTEALEGG